MKNTIFIIFILLTGVIQNAVAQKIIRQSLSSLGGSNSINKSLIQQTIGQSSNTTIFYYEKSCVRQGFLQVPRISITDNSNYNKIILNVYPNPVNNNFILKINGSGNTFIYKITDILGQCILIDDINQNKEQTINTNGWSKGVYFIQIYSENKLEGIKKIIKF